jgi:hypothetical protein
MAAGKGTSTPHPAKPPPPCCNVIVVHQACNERLRSPRTKRGIHFQALSAQVAHVLVGQIGFYGFLVNEDKLIRMGLHGRKVVFEPVSAAFLHMGAQPFGGNQRPFYMCNRACAGTVRWRQSVRQRQWKLPMLLQVLAR